VVTSFESEIEKLLALKREGQYWDYKKVHHENKAELLHDILCLANALHKGNKYLIFGVSDPREDCQIKGIENDAKRRSQSDIIDFLRSKPFAGDIRPEIKLRTIEVEDHQIDILIIFNKPQKPYYLREEYRDRDKLIRANCIYTRIVDMNTPIDSSADIQFIELMWRERFGLDTQPGERMVKLLLEPEDWDKDIGNKKYAYHKYSPEYQIEFGDTREFKEVFSYFYPNEKSFIGEARFKYLSTTLFALSYMYCDEMRVMLAVPNNGYIRIAGREIWYMYYIFQGRNGAFLNFLTDGSFDFRSRGSDDTFLLFRDENEQKEFESFLTSNIEKLDGIEDSSLGSIIKDRIERDDGRTGFDPVEMFKVKHLFSWWKSKREVE
jgi:hypothetical protein